EVGRNTFKQPRTVKHQRTQPGSVGGRPQDAHVAFLPASVIIGPRRAFGGHSLFLSFRSWIRRGQCTVAYMIFSSVASAGENSSTMRPCRDTRIRSERFMISGR